MMLQGAAFRILACFYESDTAGFADLCKRAGYPTDLGGYYIRQLIQGGYLEKIDRGQYRILPNGKQQLAFYYGKRMLALRPRLSVIVVAKRAGSLIVTDRQVQPFIGTIEWPATTVNMGETIAEAAKRVIKDRLNTEAQATMVGFFRRIDLYQDTVFDDKVFAVHTCELEPEAAYSPSSATGHNHAHTLDELQQLKNLSKALLDILDYAGRGQSQLAEHAYHLTAEDLSLDTAV